jgi:hypothetical protein
MMRKGILGAAAAVVALAGGVTSAHARPHDADASTLEIFTSHFSLTATHAAYLPPDRPRAKRSKRSAREGARPRRETVAYRSYHGVGPRPRRWCGWWMRTQRGGGPELNMARNWARWGSASSPQVGAVVVWRSHVGEIVGRADNGHWIVRSGNDGGRVRSRARSLAGVIAIRM